MRENQEIAKDYTDWMVKTGGFARDMTLRDYFAAKAIEKDVEKHERQSRIKEVPRKDGLGNERFTEIVCYTREQAKYRYADAMLKERTK